MYAQVYCTRWFCACSKRILLFNVNADPPANPKQLYLQKALRVYASNFMQDNLMGLQNMPSHDEVRRLQDFFMTQIQQQIAAERQVGGVCP